VNTYSIKASSEKFLINTYGERQTALVRGSGATVWDAEGREYLDFFAGIAVTNLGHCHPAVVKAVQQQAATLMHVSNLYHTEPQTSLAERLATVSFADKWFFCNSGCEANEGALKLVRKYWNERGTSRPKIVAAENSFHGRTMMTLSATGQKKFQRGFEPMVPAFVHVPFNDLNALEAVLDDDTGAIILEPVQGEGGVIPADKKYLRSVRDLCDDRSILLVFDEIQTGMGRTGQMFAYEHYRVEPDIITVAKALANGIPIGGIGARDAVAMAFGPGSHASTFGGNPVAAAAANAVVQALTNPGFLSRVREAGTRLFTGANRVGSRHSCVVEVRGLGLMMGIELTCPAQPVVTQFLKEGIIVGLKEGIIVGSAGKNVLRFLPPLVVADAEIDRVLKVLDNVLGKYNT